MDLELVSIAYEPEGEAGQLAQLDLRTLGKFRIFWNPQGIIWAPKTNSLGRIKFSDLERRGS